ncbi:TIGR03545 family protein, partial [Candidatus Margulisiibacteriota bacterium]
LIKNSQKIFGAKVEINDAKIKFSPLGFTLKGIAVADKSREKQNLFEIGQLRADLHFKQLLKKKFIMDTVIIKDVSFATKRKTSGKLKMKTKKEIVKEVTAQDEELEKTKKTEPDKKAKKMDLAKLTEKIDIDQILASQTPASVKKAKEVQKTAAALEQKWQKVLKSAVYDEKVGVISKEVNQLTKMELKDFQDADKKVKDILKMINDLKTDLEGQKDKFETDYKLLKSQINQVTALGNKDYQKFSSLISAGSLKTENITKMILGQETHNKLTKAITTIKTVKRYLPLKKLPGAPKKPVRRKGLDISFPKYGRSVFPGLWIKKIVLSGKGKHKEEIDGYLNDLTSDQAIINKPTRIKIAAKNILLPSSALFATGWLDFRRRESESKIEVLISDIPLEKKTIHHEGNKKLVLKTGTGKVSSNFLFQREGFLGNVDFYGDKLVFSTSGINKNELSFASILTNVVTQFPSLTVKGKISGTLTNPDISLTSDLDRRFSKAVSKLVQNKVNEAKRALKKSLGNLVQGEQRKLLEKLNLDKGGINKLLTENLSEVNKYQQEIEKKKKEVNEAVNKLRREAEARLKKEQVELERQKKLKEAELKKEMDKQQHQLDKAKDDLQNKIKSLF